MRSFRRLTMYTIAAVYLLILVGGIVRSSGSGMGCPDWPKCFGAWVPPNSVSELPENYKQVYSDYRSKKNYRFAKYLSTIGLKDAANGILEDKTILKEADFNVFKTWTEYVNRLIGVIIGFLIFAVFVMSVRFRKKNRKLTIVALLTFLLVGVQGWFGSIVVSTNLTPWVVTLHMFLALLIVGMLIYLVHQSMEEPMKIASPNGFWWLMACMVVLVVQVLVGTQVREAIDRIAGSVGREYWVTSLGGEFVLHRSFSWVVFALHIGLVRILAKSPNLKGFSLTLILLILGTLITGMGMAFLGVPPFLQPLHLLLATMSFGMQFFLLLKLNTKEKIETVTT